MRLTKLELNGFKSFARKTEILFDEGITAIVGPNGSGKSNVADAIRWVLGEQSARLLRGTRMEDVIFSGTETRNKMSYCEVTLTFDNSDGLLPLDYAEVSITRRVYRSGDSEYCINNSNCRLKDINELFRDTGLGKEGYSIVGQGKVEEILSNKSGERRKAFEEAAGIMKYRVRKEEAERKLDNTRKNLMRLFDILSEVEQRIEPLGEQAERANSFLLLRDELRELEINLFLYQYDKTRERQKAIADVISELSSEIAILEQKRQKTSNDSVFLEESERELTGQLSLLQNDMITAASALEAKLGELKLIDERILNSVKECERIKGEIANREVRKKEITERLNAKDGEAAGREELLNGLRNDADEARNGLIAINTEIQDREFEVERLKDEMINAIRQLGDAKSKISHFDAVLETLSARLSEIESGKDAYSEDYSGLQAEYNEAKNDLEIVESRLTVEKGRLLASVSAVNETAHKLSLCDNELRSTEQLIEGKRSRLNVLSEMKRAHEGYYASVRNILSDCERDPSLKACTEGVVAELISVPKDFEIAIEMTLGNSLQNIVTPDEQSAKQLISHLRKMNYGRATMLPVTSMKPRTVTADERRFLRAQGCLGIASELVKYDARYKNVVENLLGRTVIVENLDVGIAINRNVGQSLRIATLEGDIINPGGSMTGGSTVKREFSLLGREREQAELLQGIDNLKRKLQSLKNDKSQLTAALEAANSENANASASVHETEIVHAQQVDKLDAIDYNLKQYRKREEEFDAEKQRISDNIQDILEQKTAAEAVQSKLSEGDTVTQADIVAAQGVITSLRTEQTKRNEALTDLRVRITAFEKESDALIDETERLSKELRSIIALNEYDVKAIEQYSVELSRMRAEREEAEQGLGSEQGATDTMSAKCDELTQKRVELQATLDNVRAERDELDEFLTDKKDKLHKQELSQNKSDIELATMQDKMWEEYELTYENAQVYRRPIAVTASHQRVDEIKTAIRELGDINVNAVEEYKALSERYLDMRAQYDDLQRAESDLVELIDDVTGNMERDFKEKFVQIRDNFRRVFSELFGGGTAELNLADSSDVLNCDIEILAQIPGKRLQSLEPLSGGERALTAIAIQFAILGLKPTAFCLLDEIDASLDEVNVTRFAGYIHAYAQSTQFILITHRKGSMEACNSLYGVAQEEKGISKIVSARISRLESA